ncbi:hypothetical protein H072_3478 [Dactylellina haptotyla CBS 200.50]|uniref:Peptidase S8/S53 domain-containing protein n=1 Tax=Dactylellina haptotyla (strain CBS 200.50) TaxID=1284197 RepID=S8C4D0_DACHA|nr:hypothetical protein H072_3478 [Dactylellina haptotyla CBS 200.50]
MASSTLSAPAAPPREEIAKIIARDAYTTSRQDESASPHTHKGYLIRMADDEKRSWTHVLSELGVNQTHSPQVFGRTVRMAAVDLSHEEARTISRRGNVASIEKNYIRRAAVMPSKSKARVMARGWRHDIRRRQADSMVVQNTATWGLERISTNATIDLGDRNAEDTFFKYKFDRLSGSGVDVYVLDSGININHVDFAGRAKMVFTAFDDNGEDKAGHGTHTAGTVGSLTYGVAKNVNIMGVKVLNDKGEGEDAGISKGIDAVIDMHEERKAKLGFMGSVITMSIGEGGTSITLGDIVRRASQAGIHIVVSAGNEGGDACGADPARLSTQMPVITVGATDIQDQRAKFSNWGKCVDIHAPGVDVVSTWNEGNRSVKSEEGTSMAAPHVAGVIATELAKNGQFKTDPEGMKKWIMANALDGVIKGGDKVMGGAKYLLNTGIGGGSSNTTMKAYYMKSF